MTEIIEPILKGDVISFTYTNYAGEPAVRRAKVLDFGWGNTPWHEEPQWLMLGFDMEKNAGRKYAMRDMSEIVKEIAPTTGRNNPT